MPVLPTTESVESNAERPTRKIYLGEWLEAKIWDEKSILPGTDIVGPALIEGELRTVLAGPGDRVAVDERGNLHIAPAHAWLTQSRQSSTFNNGGSRGR
jgi:N-methylhydantoinase A/oxoprolinase/acetone carboxylase beta subunit